MIKVYGTSHVSEESFDVIDEAFKEVDPDVVALELCPVRLKALIQDTDDSGGPFFMRILRWFQNYIGKKTGVMPGTEMLYAYEKAADEEKDVILVDQDIRITVQNLMSTRRKERVKAVAMVAASFVIPGRNDFDITEIPEDRKIVYMLQEFRERFPGIYQAIVEDRNRYMTQALRDYQERHPDQDIAVFVGAAHKSELKRELE